MLAARALLSPRRSYRKRLRLRRKATGRSLPYNLRFPGQYYQAETGLNQNWFRDYDPLVGKYVESDPIGLGGGVNSYAYVGDSPVWYVDRDGRFFFVPIVTGVIGGVVGFGGNLGAQLLRNGGNWSCVNWKNAFIAGGTGAVAGALAPFVATTTAGAIGLGAISNLAQYGITQTANGNAVTASGLGWAGITGAVAGWIGGSVPSVGSISYSTSSPWLDPAVAAQLNQASQTANNVATTNLLRQAATALPTNAPLPGSSDSECGCH